jgi:aldehyde:ferredoxin oxidoreductase
MERNDAQTAIDLFYEAMGWDKATGAPTIEAYRRAGLDEVAGELSKRKLLP